MFEKYKKRGEDQNEEKKRSFRWFGKRVKEINGRDDVPEVEEVTEFEEIPVDENLAGVEDSTESETTAKKGAEKSGEKTGEYYQEGKSIAESIIKQVESGKMTREQAREMLASLEAKQARIYGNENGTTKGGGSANEKQKKDENLEENKNEQQGEGNNNNGEQAEKSKKRGVWEKLKKTSAGQKVTAAILAVAITA